MQTSTIMSTDRSTMEKIYDVYNRQLIEKINDSIDLIMKTYQTEMRERFRIPRSMTYKYKEDIYFMVDTNFTYIEEVEPHMMYVEPLGYEIIEEEIERYEKIILEENQDKEFDMLGTNKELMQSASQAQLEKFAKNKVEAIMKNLWSKLECQVRKIVQWKK